MSHFIGRHPLLVFCYLGEEEMEGFVEKLEQHAAIVLPLTMIHYIRYRIENRLGFRTDSVLSSAETL